MSTESDQVQTTESNAYVECGAIRAQRTVRRVTKAHEQRPWNDFEFAVTVLRPLAEAGKSRRAA